MTTGRINQVSDQQTQKKKKKQSKLLITTRAFRVDVLNSLDQEKKTVNVFIPPKVVTLLVLYL